MACIQKRLLIKSGLWWCAYGTSDINEVKCGHACVVCDQLQNACTHVHHTHVLEVFLHAHAPSHVTPWIWPLILPIFVAKSWEKGSVWVPMSFPYPRSLHFFLTFSSESFFEMSWKLTRHLWGKRWGGATPYKTHLYWLVCQEKPTTVSSFTFDTHLICTVSRPFPSK